MSSKVYKFVLGVDVARLCSFVTVLLLALPVAAQRPITLLVEDQTAASGSEVEVGLQVSGATRLGPVQFELAFDPEVLEAVAVDAGSQLSGSADFYVPQPGQVNVGVITNSAIEQDGELVKVRFLVKGPVGSKTRVAIVNPQAYEYGVELVDLLVDTEDGSFEVTGVSWWWILLPIAIVVVIAMLLWSRRRGSNKRLAAPESSLQAAPATAPGRSSVAESSSKRFCCQCGASLEPADRFCGGCGSAVEL